jgi:hypothetical protein
MSRQFFVLITIYFNSEFYFKYGVFEPIQTKIVFTWKLVI